ncbi:carbohydrate kinase [Hymenobacter sp. DG25B]|uniref:bifunctional ADP-dependent NAD(P)H-hydrate dehydratase/NAD(P)H-hydrate epimerase n=1 Tax=Hymenobacter sp. DG25B TaxID=1385664 RepID=UPI00054092F5|nr:bifunctional ADP-dependent NAD(P)H-hydrate dehydratase/NAD(P)H-hydrate epimerase [Hymenobacter sp. DG25B]AIZ62978.1 carbohydrate kinase [Hymenobacter sp. DG25B]
MKLLSASQTRQADQATIQAEGIRSEDLMERAATALARWLMQRLPLQTPAREIHVFCGPGNNGGDGLAAARLLHHAGYPVQVWLLPASQHSPDFTLNRQRLPADVPCQELHPEQLPALPQAAVVVDALFGTGLTRPLEDPAAALVHHLNQAAVTVVAVDVPSGLLLDAPQPSVSAVVQAKHTISFDLPKLAFLLPQNAPYVGEWHVLPIGLAVEVIHNLPVDNYFVDEIMLMNRLPHRQTFSHKGTYGRALLLLGSYGKIGAGVLAARACLHSGVGLLTVSLPATGYNILQTAVPEAMALTDSQPNHLCDLPELKPYSAIGIGPGVGQHDDTRSLLEELLCTSKAPLVLDADALNLMAANRPLLDLLPPDSILTPHPKEFERLTEPARNDYHRLELLRTFCQQYRCFTVLKGAYTCTGTPTGELYFNSTGNPGMATGGSGDVLTGVLTALRAQGLTPLDACLVGVYAHGRAGDLAALQTGEMGLTASDLVAQLGPALRELTPPKTL